MTFRFRVVSDARLMRIPVRECGECLVDVRDYVANIRTVGASCRVRERVAVMLAVAWGLLPRGVVLKVVEGFRSMREQRRLYRRVIRELRLRFPGLSREGLGREADKWVANPARVVPPHTTGGAVDVTLTDGNGRELWMGSRVNTISGRSATHVRGLSARAGANRELLVKVMKKAGFVNYPLEWWHWSFGDQLWAFVKRKKRAVYGSL